VHIIQVVQHPGNDFLPCGRVKLFSWVTTFSLGQNFGNNFFMRPKQLLRQKLPTNWLQQPLFLLFQGKLFSNATVKLVGKAGRQIKKINLGGTLQYR